MVDLSIAMLNNQRVDFITLQCRGSLFFRVRLTWLVTKMNLRGLPQDAKWGLKMRLTSSYGSLIENIWIYIDILVQIQGVQNMRQPQACIKSSHDDCGSKIQDMFARHCKMQCFIIFAIFQKKHSAVNLLINRFLGHVFFPILLK